MVDMTEEYVSIRCNKCGKIFKQKRARHIAGDGCPFCRKFTLEDKMKRILNEYNVDYIYQYRPAFLKHGRGQKSLDFYLPKQNIAIECQGIQHFQEVEYFRDKLEYTLSCDKVKRKLCEKNGIKIFYIYSRKKVKDCILEKYNDFYFQDNLFAIEDIYS